MTVSELWRRYPPIVVDAVVATFIVVLTLPFALLASEVETFGWRLVAITAMAWLLMTLRRTNPGIVLAAATGITVLVAALGDRPGGLVPAVLVSLFTYCLGARRRDAIVAGVLVASTLYTTALITEDVGPSNAAVVIMVTWSAIAVAVADAIRSTRQTIAAANERARQAEETKEAEAQRRVAEERMSIARDLHDALGHNLSVMVVHTGVAEHMLSEGDVDRARESLHAARSAGQSVLGEVRQVLGVLRSDASSGAPLDTLPGIEQIASLVDAVRSAGADVRWTRHGSTAIATPLVGLAAYRVVQEALTNATRHGEGSVSLDTACDGRRFTISIVNAIHADGGEPGSGLGLVGMRERVAAAGGSMSTSNDGRRFAVRVELPLTDEEDVGPGVEAMS
jgi:signal transduction histidine kinase